LKTKRPAFTINEIRKLLYPLENQIPLKLEKEKPFLFEAEMKRTFPTNVVVFLKTLPGRKDSGALRLASNLRTESPAKEPLQKRVSFSHNCFSFSVGSRSTSGTPPALVEALIYYYTELALSSATENDDDSEEAKT
jgi:hypothetical protein